jgi:putative ABC transport system permease protein
MLPKPETHDPLSPGSFRPISLTQTSLLDQVSIAGSGNRPNLVLFDVQPDQREGVRALLLRNQLAVQQEVPIVTMRLSAINQIDNRNLRADSEIPEWTLRREYRSSYRTQLIESESLVAGRLVSDFRWDGDPNTPIPVTVEEGIAKDLKIKLGDKVRFDVQGVPILTEIVGVRRVDWRRVQTNFFFLFPAGVLEEAPQFFAIMTRANTLESLAAVQREVISLYGNISAIDLNLILETADTVLSKVAVAIQFLAIFTIVSGLCILAGALATTRAARLKELLLLKTVGATRRQTLTITIIEFMLLATLSALVGVGASLVGGWVIANWYFESSFSVPWNELLLLYGAVLLAVFAVGVVMTLGLLRISPIEALRSYQG